MPRRVEISIETTATPERVWRAITEAEDVAGWFAPEVSVEPGPEGSMTLGWDASGRVVAASTVESDLRGAKGTKTEQAKAVGLELAKRAKAAGITQVIFDRGGYLYHGRVKALADGAREGGLDF